MINDNAQGKASDAGDVSQDYFNKSGALSFPELLLCLGVQKKLLIGVTVFGAICSVVVSLLLPKYYTASTLIIAPQPQQGSAAGLVAQLSPVIGLAGNGSGAKTPDEMFVAILRTRRMRDALIEKFNLRDHYGLSTNTDVRAKLGSVVTVNSDKKTGLISIEVDDKDPNFAATLANAHVDELATVTSTLSITEAQQRRRFYEQQVERTRGLLAKAESEFRLAQAKSGLFLNQTLADTSIKASVDLRAQIESREVQLMAAQRFATDQNPDIQRLQAEIKAAKEKLKKIEYGGREIDEHPLSAEGVDTVRAFRDMKVRESTLDVLIRQLEVARMDESREGQVIQQVDPAVPPERPSKPMRTFIVGAGTALAFVLGLFLALVRHSALRNGESGTSYWVKFRSVWF